MDATEQFYYHNFGSSPSTFAVDTAVEKAVPSFTYPRLSSSDAIARSACVRCEGEGSFVFLITRDIQPRIQKLAYNRTCIESVS